jgi:hypothetical protein
MDPWTRALHTDECICHKYGLCTMQCSSSKHDILVWTWILIRICRFMPLKDPDADADPAIFVIDCQDANKNYFKKVLLLETF